MQQFEVRERKSFISIRMNQTATRLENIEHFGNRATGYTGYVK